MIKRSYILLGSLLAACCLMLSGCSFSSSQPAALLYDLGPPSSMPSAQRLPDDMPALVVSRVTAPDWLDTTVMHYRLAHVNDQQARFFTQSRWNMSPPKLFGDRLKSRIASAGGTVIGKDTHKKAGRLRLIVSLEDFSQLFQDDTHSEGRIALRLSVLDKDGIIAQKSFLHTVKAPTSDAQGGVQALTVCTDELITEMLTWVENNYKKAEAR